MKKTSKPDPSLKPRSTEHAVLEESLGEPHHPIDMSKWDFGTNEERHEFVLMLRAGRVHAWLKQIFEARCDGNFFHEIAAGNMEAPYHPLKRALRATWALAGMAQNAVVMDRDLLKAGDLLARAMYQLGFLLGEMRGVSEGFTLSDVPDAKPPSDEEARVISAYMTGLAKKKRANGSPEEVAEFLLTQPKGTKFDSACEAASEKFGTKPRTIARRIAEARAIKLLSNGWPAEPGENHPAFRKNLLP